MFFPVPLVHLPPMPWKSGLPVEPRSNAYVDAYFDRGHAGNTSGFRVGLPGDHTLVISLSRVLR